MAHKKPEKKNRKKMMEKKFSKKGKEPFNENDNLNLEKAQMEEFREAHPHTK